MTPIYGLKLASLLRCMTSVAVFYCFSGPLVIFPSKAVDNYVLLQSLAAVTNTNTNNKNPLLGIASSPIRCEDLVVRPLSLIGAGGTGTVYQSVVVTSSSSSSQLQSGDDVVIKIGNTGSNDRLENECSILRHLSSYNAPGFERFCLFLYIY